MKRFQKGEQEEPEETEITLPLFALFLMFVSCPELYFSALYRSSTFTNSKPPIFPDIP